jgi:hypothetical protein
VRGVKKLFHRSSVRVDSLTFIAPVETPLRLFPPFHRGTKKCLSPFGLLLVECFVDQGLQVFVAGVGSAAEARHDAALLVDHDVLWK